IPILLPFTRFVSADRITPAMTTIATRDPIPTSSSSLWTEPLSVSIGGRSRLLSQFNFAGKNYPARHLGVMARLLDIPPQARVLDLVLPSFLPTDTVLSE